MRLFFFLLTFIFFALSSDAQTPNLNRKLQQIDSLVTFNQVDKATKKIDSLNQWLTSQPQNVVYQKTKIQLAYYTAHINATSFKNSIALKIALDCITQAKKYKHPEWEFKTYLLVASLYEQSKDLYKMCERTLDESYTLYKTHKLDHLYSTYCIRKSSYYRFTEKKDSAIFYAVKGFDYAKKYTNSKDKIDALLLLGILYQSIDYKKSIHFSTMAAHEFAHQNDKNAAASQYLNIAKVLLKVRQLERAITFADSAYSLYAEQEDVRFQPLRYFDIKQQIYFAKGQFDSAYVYLNKLNNANLANQNNLDKIEVNRIAEKYENEKKEEIIKDKNQQFNFAACLLIVTTLATILVVRKNRKIKTQNLIIKQQLNELNEVLDVKKTLLSELQHRVKNNLQNIMSILEIQKESADFNNIDELIRANQNRVQSMVLIHQRLEVSQDMDHIKAENYINDLATLVRDSYMYLHKKIELDVQCTIEELSINQAQPLGMILVELISNSSKHAFKEQKSGVIHINMRYDLNSAKTQLHYMDNGIGFDSTLQNKGKGLGLEIIYGLINQLNGNININRSHKKGFSLTISF